MVLVLWSLFLLLSLLSTLGPAAADSSSCIRGNSLTFQRKIHGLSLQCHNADFPSRFLSNVRGGQDASQEQALGRATVTNDETVTKRIKLKWPLGEGLTNAVGGTAMGFLGGLILGLILAGSLRETSSVETSFDDNTLLPSVEVLGVTASGMDESLLDGESGLQIQIDDTDSETTIYEFSLFQSGDGSETDPDGIPGRFLRMQKGNRQQALVALQATLNFREEHAVDTILSRPHPQLDICKLVLPHYFAGRDPTNHVIFVQRPGLIQMQLAEVNNITTEDLLHHYIWTLEYCWNVLEPRPDQTMTSVIDLEGLSFGSVKQMFGFVKEFVNVMSLHYPQRSYKTLLINSPRWFHTLYRMISPILRESTKSKIQILSGGKKQRDMLQELLGDVVPRELLGEEDELDGNGAENHTGPMSPMEMDMRQFVSDTVSHSFGRFRNQTKHLLIVVLLLVFAY